MADSVLGSDRLKTCGYFRVAAQNAIFREIWLSAPSEASEFGPEFTPWDFSNSLGHFRPFAGPNEARHAPLSRRPASSAFPVMAARRV